MFNEHLGKFWPNMCGTSLEPHKEKLKAVTELVIEQINQGDLSRWVDAYQQLPDIEKAQVVTGANAVTIDIPDQTCDKASIDSSMRRLIPWRKGPFQIADTYIDAEWRSDFKWQRLSKALPDLNNRIVLDVGCGNGYYMFRMAEHQPRVLIGVEPGLLQNVQFWAVEKYAQTYAAVLPLKVQDLPADMACFDVVFSMGILYHRKSPMAHLEQLKSLLAKEGILVLETLVVDGDELTCLVPNGRYAQMRNVWFLPSVPMLCGWLKKIGFKNIHVIDESLTSVEEQRTTQWMKFHSLSEFLTADHKQTIEGYSPPKRAIISCRK
ncbi:MAG: tRNA 5-methoxyuridine(34)/uridine 5-oxyacetic acid(34) synthase CmoB [Proteobacteria bacterium]|nr:MAG: tRNA 5-methoxyuridine(34)/uridine 5-oxyacetic acid(34) synthase CmoB [Pseudomonadota bacterium]